VRVIRILALGTRRGPAAEARLLYADLDAPEAPAAVDDGLEPARQADT
jgi:ribosome-associated heat shock protein Hsp15